MKDRKRTPRGSAMDGFVRRDRSEQKRRVSLDNAENKRGMGSGFDDFVPRHEDSHQQIKVDENDEYSNQPITLEPGELKADHTDLKPKSKTRLWGRKNSKRSIDPTKKSKKKLIKRTILLILLIGILVGGFLGWKVLKNTSKIFNGNVLGFFDSTKLRGEENGRVNILLAGTSEDDPGHDGAMLTDSIMLVSIDTVNNSAFMTSVPRDLWVNYETKKCSVGYQGKINAVYTCGEQTDFKEAGYPDGGMGLLQKVVEENFGIDINYFAKINYTAFEQAVNAVGGIDITLKTDDPRGILDRIFDWECNYKCYKVKYPNGPVHLNGEQALDLARSRGDVAPTYGTGYDFGRTERQRLMLIGLKDKALSVGILANPAKISSLLDAAGNNVDTNFKTNELRRLYEIGKNVNSKNIKSIGLTDEGVELVESFRAPNGASAVRPTAGTTNFTQIKAFIKKLTSNDPVIREGASVVVLNGSGVIGLAQKNADQLTAKGITISGIGNATQRDSTVIIDMSKDLKNGTKSMLEKEFRVVSTKDINTVPEAVKYQADFVVVIGKSATSSVNN